VSENISRLALCTCCHRSCTFKQHLFILSVLVSRFLSWTCICVFRCWNISGRYASFVHHSTLANTLRNQTPYLWKTQVHLATHTHRPVPCCTTAIRPLYWAIRRFALLPFPHKEMQRCDCSQVVSSQNLQCVQHCSTQALDQGSQTRGPRVWPARVFCAARDGFWEFSNNEHLHYQVPWKKMPWNNWIKAEQYPVRFSSWP